MAVHAVELQAAALGAAGQQAAVGGGGLTQVESPHLTICTQAPRHAREHASERAQ